MSVNLNQSLYNTSEALNLHTRSIEVSGQNMANVHNEHYACRKVRMSSSAHAIASGSKGGVSTGVIDMTIVTERDQLIDRQILKSIMKAETLVTQEKLNSSLESLIGERFQIDPQAKTDKGSDFGSIGFIKEIDNFFNSCSTLSAQPSNKALKSEVVSSASNVVNKLYSISTRLVNSENDIKLSIEQNVREVNSLLNRIADQTKKIFDFEIPNPNEEALELRESRQGSLEALAKLIDFEVSDENNTFKLTLKDDSNNDVILIENGYVENEMTFDSSSDEVKFGASVLNINGGALHGNLHTKTDTIDFITNTLNAWTKAFVESVNDAYNETRTAPPLDVNGDFFDVQSGGTTIDSIKLLVTKDSLRTSFDAGNDTKNDKINAIVDLRDAQISDLSNMTFGGYYRKFVVDTAQTFKNASDSLSDENVVRKMLIQQRENTIGVSIDNELINIIRSQKAFQAAAKVLTIIDEMIEQTINLVRR